MVGLEKIRGEMSRWLEDDMARVSVEVSADTLEEAMASAAVELGIPIREIDYEVLQKGSRGFLAFSPKKEWKIRAYKSVSISFARQQAVKAAFQETEEEENVPLYKDGSAFVFLGKDGVYLKVTAPEGNGTRVSLKDAQAALAARNIRDADENAVKAAVEKQEGAYTRVGNYEYYPASNPLLSVEISPDEMKAWIYVTPPEPGGADLSADEIISFLKKSRVVSGINEKRINDFVDKPIYREQYLAAEGSEAKDGQNAYIQYNFRTENTINLQETEEGRIDFKELNIVQNVVEGQPLAKKIQAQRGQGGKTVTGRYLEAKNGKDISLPLGKNTRLADDGITILSEINGQAILHGGRINVEPVLNISGDVSLKTGNIMFLGTVNVSGSVEDGFTVKATGNIDIKGSVGKAVLDAEGDIIVGGGVMGKGEGSIRSGKSIWARFIENTTVTAEEFVIVSDGIVNSQVSANKKIICRGKRAAIIGGNLIASEEISAKTLGSVGAGSETILSVGFDPKSKARLDELAANKATAENELAEVKLNYNTLVNLKKERQELPKEKEQQLKELSERKYVLQNEIAEIDAENAQIQNYLNSIKTRGKVSASAKVFAGVKIVIRDVVEDVRMECKATTFYLENGLIRYGKYQESTEDRKRAPSGYISN